MKTENMLSQIIYPIWGINGQWLTVWAALQNGTALSGGEAAAQQSGNKLFYNKFSSLINLILYPANVTNSKLQGTVPSFLYCLTILLLLNVQQYNVMKFPCRSTLKPIFTRHNTGIAASFYSTS